jgi:hypothetical protein
MTKNLKLAAFLLAAAAIHLPAAAAPVVDQSNPSNWAGFCFTNDAFGCGQSFRQDNSNIAGGGFFIDPSYGDGTNGTVTISVHSAYPNGPSSLLASGTAAGINMNSGWVDVFWAPVAITSGAQYYLIINSTNPIVASYGNSAYADGNAVYFGSETAYAGYDLTFRTYADNAIAQVPEPGSLGLLAIGIAGLGVALRKKANSKRAA